MVSKAFSAFDRQHMSSREYRAAERGESWKMQLIVTIEDAMAIARSREHFIRLMEAEGYEVKWTRDRKSITYTMPDGKRCRDHIESLDQGAYYSIINSAIVNSKALKGKKKPRFLDKSQKKSPLNRVTVIVIFAKRIDEKFKIRLFDTVCKNSGDGFDTSVLSCVLDLETQVCTFDSMRIPYMGFQYPAKNRGIRIIRKYLFNNRFPFTNSPDMLDPIKDFNPEQSLWSFWRTTKKELILEDKQNQKRFEKMAHREIVLEDDYLYLKWKDRGVWLSVEFNEELRTAEIDAIDSWDYPKINKISKDTIKELKNLIDAHFAQLGYTTKYISLDEYN